MVRWRCRRFVSILFTGLSGREPKQKESEKKTENWSRGQGRRAETFSHHSFEILSDFGARHKLVLRAAMIVNDCDIIRNEETEFATPTNINRNKPFHERRHFALTSLL